MQWTTAILPGSLSLSLSLPLAKGESRFERATDGFPLYLIIRAPNNVPPLSLAHHRRALRGHQFEFPASVCSFVSSMAEKMDKVNSQTRGGLNSSNSFSSKENDLMLNALMENVLIAK